jgi:benzoyl-CoA reductase/2-hydroxyglutaryl-CoA dehydratase subunit BcrC/BadD/HgdB
VQQIRDAQIDGVVAIGREQEDGCQSRFGTEYLVQEAIKSTGVPLLKLAVDNADARSWDDTAVKNTVADFIEQQILAKRT